MVSSFLAGLLGWLSAMMLQISSGPDRSRPHGMDGSAGADADPCRRL